MSTTIQSREVCEVCPNPQLQQTNCWYTEHGQRIAYYQLDDSVSAFVDIDRGIWGFLKPGSVGQMHNRYLDNQYEYDTSKYCISYRTREHAHSLTYPPVNRK
jgi:hypothetical protein